MTLVPLPSPMLFPGLGQITGALSLGNTTAITAAGHYIAYVFCAKEDMTISHVAFRIGSATGTCTLDVRIESVDNTGFPGGLWATNTNVGSGNVVANTNYIVALTAPASITKGQMFCLKLAYSTGTTVTPGALTSLFSQHQSSCPYIITNTGSPARGVIGNTAQVAFGSNSTTFYQVPGCLPPLSTITAGTFNNTNGARRGLRFTIPMNCRAIGMRFYNGTQNGDFNAALYSDAGSELSSSSTAFDGNGSAESASGTISVYFDNTVTLTAGTTYRLVVEPSSATNVNVTTVTPASADYRSAMPAGTMAHYTTFASAAWDDTNTSLLPLMELIIDQVDNGSGTGGGVGVVSG